jgi:3-phosphoshikimate 1-carboxyvinyltransferase
MVTTYKYMNLLLQTSNNDLQALIAVTGSKSETNRLLLLQALFPIALVNTSNSDDSSNADGF